MTQPLALTLLPERFAVCRLAPDAPVPGWWDRGAFASVTRTAEELSIVCDEVAAPDGPRVERGWRAFKLEGPFPFEATGILAAIAVPLATAGVGIFAISTFDTDHVMVKDAQLDEAVRCLRAAGHELIGA